MTTIQSSNTESPEERSLNAVFDCLASSDRRRVLGILDEQAPNSLSRRELATRLVSSGRSDTAESDRDVQQASRVLYHTHLPKLEAAKLIVNDTDGKRIAITDHPAFDDERISAVIHSDSDTTSDSLAELFRALADGRRRTILDVLSHQLTPIYTDTLARELGAKEQGIAEAEVPADTVDEILAQLTHVHLPKLADTGLVEYDSGEQTVAYAGHPQLSGPWIHSMFQPEFR